MTHAAPRLELLALLALLASALAPGRAAAQAQPLVAGARIEQNVVYGMYSGLALLLDVHRPAASNGYGVIFISGSGWQAPTTYDATPLKQNQIPIWGPPLVRPATRSSRSTIVPCRGSTTPARSRTCSAPYASSGITPGTMRSTRRASAAWVVRRAGT